MFLGGHMLWVLFIDVIIVIETIEEKVVGAILRPQSTTIGAVIWMWTVVTVPPTNHR